ncbi:hypothetical protein [Pseudomonas putida]
MKPVRAQSGAGLHGFFVGFLASAGAAMPSPVSRDMRLEFAKMNGPLDAYAARALALGGPWELLIKANVLYSPFTRQTHKMIAMFCPHRKIAAPCAAIGQASSDVPRIIKTKVAEQKLVNISSLNWQRRENEFQLAVFSRLIESSNYL